MHTHFACTHKLTLILTNTHTHTLQEGFQAQDDASASEERYATATEEETAITEMLAKAKEAAETARARAAVGAFLGEGCCAPGCMRVRVLGACGDVWSTLCAGSGW